MVSSVGFEASAGPEGSEATTMVGGSYEEWDHVLEQYILAQPQNPFRSLKLHLVYLSVYSLTSS